MATAYARRYPISDDMRPSSSVVWGAVELGMRCGKKGVAGKLILVCARAVLGNGPSRRWRCPARAFFIGN